MNLPLSRQSLHLFLASFLSPISTSCFELVAMKEMGSLYVEVGAASPEASKFDHSSAARRYAGKILSERLIGE